MGPESTSTSMAMCDDFVSGYHHTLWHCRMLSSCQYWLPEFKYLRETWNLYGACNKVLAAWLMPPTLVATAKDGRIIDLVKREPEFLVVKLNCR